MKKLFYTLLTVSQIGLIWQKFWAYDSIHWGAVFVPVYVLVFIAVVAIIVMEMRDNEHPGDFNF